MAEGIDVVQFGESLRRIRRGRGARLQDVADAVKISVATLSRVERGAAKDIESGTLLALSAWMGTAAEAFSDNPLPPPLPTRTGKPVKETPDVIDLYLR